MMRYFAEIPEYQALAVIEHRVEGYCLIDDPAWMSVAVDVARPPSDDLAMLLLMKYDMAVRPHRIQIPF